MYSSRDIIEFIIVIVGEFAKRHEMSDALRLLYSSKTFENLKKKNSGLYFQSPGYVYEYLRRELKL